MKLIERVYYSILGKPVKNLLFFLVVTLLGAFLSASFSIYQANQNLEKEVRERLNPVVLVEWNGYDEENDTILYGKEEERQGIIQQYKKDSRIKVMENRYNLFSSFFVNLIDENNLIIDNFGYPLDTHLHQENEVLETYYNDKSIVINLVGIDNPKISDIQNGTADLISGRVFDEEDIASDDNKIFILKYYNSRLSLFDDRKTIRLKAPTSYIYYKENFMIDHIDYDLGEFEIVGIGKQVDNQAELKYHSIYTNTSSGYYISSVLMDKISKEMIAIHQQLGNKYPWYKEEPDFEYYGMKYLSETYIELENADDLNTFIDDIKKDGGDLIREVYSFSDSYNDVQTITKSLNLIAIISLVVCSVASIILLSLIIQVFVNERRYEIGVYLSLGESKKNVITQILCEILLVGMIGISTSLFTGNMIGKSLLSDLLERQIQQHEEIHNGMNDQNNYEISQEEILDTYEVSITVEYIICVYAGGLVVLLLSSVYPMNSIMKMKAKKMLQ